MQEKKYLEQVQDFVNYMKKEYVIPSDGDATIIVAASDHRSTDDKYSEFACCLGKNGFLVSSISKMLDNKDFNEPFNQAISISDYAANCEQHEADLRKSRHIITAIMIANTLWLAIVSVLCGTGIIHWSTVPGLIFLAAGVYVFLYRQRKELNFKLGLLERRRIERRKMEQQTILSAMRQLLERAGGKDDDE